MCFVVFMILVAFFSPLLASDQPIVCRYQGKLYFPAVVELFQSRAPGPHWILKAKPFRLPQFSAKEELDPEAFAIWPLIPYHEREQPAATFEPPSGRHCVSHRILAN